MYQLSVLQLFRFPAFHPSCSVVTMRPIIVLLSLIQTYGWDLGFRSQVWIWGDHIPPRWTASQSLSREFPDHGMIELSLLHDVLKINIVKRPPFWLWPTHERFCSSMLPAAINSLFRDNHIDVATLRQVTVQVDADPYIVGCSCYLRVILRMGFAIRINRQDVSQENVPAICELMDPSPEIVIGWLEEGAHATLPPVTKADMDRLTRTSRVVSSFP